MLRLSLSIAMVFLAFMLPRCDRSWPDAYWRSGRYVAIAVDAPGQMSLVFDAPNGSHVVLVDATVFALGADDQHVVVKQHPKTDGFGHYDRAVTNYFVIERTDSSDFQEQHRKVRGPMTSEEFGRLVEAFRLPDFQKTFRDLQ